MDHCGEIYLGGGISFNDYNNDGWDDITIATENGTGIKIYENKQNGIFTFALGLIPNNFQQHRQVIWVDYDNDEDKDLFIASDTGVSRLYRNDDGALVDVTIIAGLPFVPISNYGASWGDYNNDSHLDLFLSNRGEPDPSANRLYRNNGNGTFTDVSVEAGILQSSDLSFCSVFMDYDNDGWQDIYVANDKPLNLNTMYRNNGDGTFTDVSAATGTDIGIDAMTVTVEDYDNDGWLDIYVTNDTDGNVLLHNNGDGTFTDIAETSGTILNSHCWSAVFLDANLDTFTDLYVSCSLDEAYPQFPSAAYFENEGDESFTIPNGSGFEGDNDQSYSNAIGDLNNDGLPDIIVSNINNEDIFLWENQSNTTNNWLKVKLVGTTSNRQGIGSWIEISSNGKVQVRYTACGEGYLGQNSDYEFFGLGDATNIDYVKVKWLSGLEDVIYNVSPNQPLTVVEGDNLLSVNDFSNDISIYPNPAKNQINIRSNSGFETLSYQIVDLSGRIVKENQIRLSYAMESYVDISMISSGVYLLKLKQNNKSLSQKIIID